MLLGLSEPSGGRARVCGFDPTREPLKVKQAVGYLPENVGFYEDISAFENLRYVARLNGLRDGVDTRRQIESALDRVGLLPEARKRVGAYSRACGSGWGLPRCS